MRKKLIEVALPLEAINEEGSRRKRKAPAGYPTTLHKWWAQRPVAAARAVIFSQMVDDPTTYVDVLRGDGKLRRRAEKLLRERLGLWKEALSLAEKAKAAGLPATVLGPAPTLDDVLADQERQRLFRIIEDLVLWDNTSNEAVLEAAREEIWQSWRRACAENADHPRAKELFNRGELPAFHDPFAGSGALPLEAQRLGLRAFASDLNPVAVLINKAMIEISPKFAGMLPVNPKTLGNPGLNSKPWRDGQGLADDLRYYGQWLSDAAESRIGNLYPRVLVSPEMVKSRPDLKPYVDKTIPVIAYLWARTVKSPNPAFGGLAVPLASTFILSTKAGKEAYVQPVIQGGDYRFTVKVGGLERAKALKNGTSAGKRAAFKCLMSGTPLPYEYIRSEGKAGRLGARLMAIVAEGDRGRVYLPPTPEMETLALAAQPQWRPDVALPANPRDFKTPNYGLMTFADLFTPRQLVALTTFSDLLPDVLERVRRDAVAAGRSEDSTHLRDGGSGAGAYAEAICMYLAMALSRLADYGSSIATWRPKDSAMRSTMPKQAIQMTWDFAEGSPFGDSSAGLVECARVVAKVIETALVGGRGIAGQEAAQDAHLASGGVAIVSTDPPYFDNIGYADLSDFFYVWLRRALGPIFPSLFATLTTPKSEELVASPYRHGGKGKAEGFFLEGMTQAMRRLASQAHPAFPMTIYYAFKQVESDGADGTTNTGWDTFLAAVLEAGLAISGTWPMRTEGDNRQIGIGSNALASSIVLVCRPRPTDAPTTTRREFVAALKAELPAALANLQRGNIAPVDLAQAAIGPGMEVFTRYAKVLDASGKALSVREALSLINETLDEALAEQEGDFDADSRWALTWFEQSGFDEGDYGVAEQLSKSKNTSVDGMVAAGILRAKGGKVRLLKPQELPEDWDPTRDSRRSAWEAVHQLLRALELGGEGSAAALQVKLGAQAEVARELAYRLYIICERKKRAAEALAYNALVQSWPELTRLAAVGASGEPEAQGSLFGEAE